MKKHKSGVPRIICRVDDAISVMSCTLSKYAGVVGFWSVGPLDEPIMFGTKLVPMKNKKRLIKIYYTKIKKQEKNDDI